jgi:hypothetical protein
MVCPWSVDSCFGAHGKADRHGGNSWWSTAAHLMAAGKQRKAQGQSQYPLQGHTLSDLTSFHEVPPPKGCTPSPNRTISWEPSLQTWAFRAHLLSKHPAVMPWWDPNSNEDKLEGSDAECLNLDTLPAVQLWANYSIPLYCWCFCKLGISHRSSYRLCYLDSNQNNAYYK